MVCQTTVILPLVPRHPARQPVCTHQPHPALPIDAAIGVTPAPPASPNFNRVSRIAPALHRSVPFALAIRPILPALMDEVQHLCPVRLHAQLALRHLPSAPKTPARDGESTRVRVRRRPSKDSSSRRHRSGYHWTAMDPPPTCMQARKDVAVIDPPRPHPVRFRPYFRTFPPRPILHPCYPRATYPRHTLRKKVYRTTDGVPPAHLRTAQVHAPAGTADPRHSSQARQLTR